MSELVAFTAEHVCKLTGLTLRQVRYWDKTEFFSPTLVQGYGKRAFGRIYSFRDVVGLRTIALLREKLPLQELRRIGAWLRQHYETPWSSLRFGMAGKKAIFYSPVDGVATEPAGQAQTVLAVAIEPIAIQMREAAGKLLERTRKDLGQIVRNRYVVHNAWSVAGTRIPTAAIWNFHQAGYSPDRIIAEYPRLTLKDVRAAIKFEAERKAA